jgi:nucleoid-associated protein EbfC
MNPPPDMNQLLRQAQQMQEQLLAAREDLAGRIYEGSSGGGAIRVMVSGSGRINSISIDPSVIDPTDPGMLGDLIVVATNQALEAASTDASNAMGGLTGGLDLGGLLG